MIKIENIEQEDFIIEYLKKFKRKQAELEEDVILYSLLPLHFALERQVFIQGLLSHPLCFKERMFYEDPVDLVNDDDNFYNLLCKILEFEINTTTENHLTDLEIQQVIWECEKLKK